MTQGKKRARVQTAGNVGETYEESERDIIQRHTIATLKGRLRNYFSVSCDILRMPLVFS